MGKIRLTEEGFIPETPKIIWVSKSKNERNYKMNHLSVFMGIILGCYLGLTILGGHYFLVFLNILFPLLTCSFIVYLVIEQIQS